MREMSKTYAVLVYGVLCICACSASLNAQTAAADNGNTCAALLSDDASVGARVGPGLSDSTVRDTTIRPRADSASFGIGGARSGAADVLLLVGVHADQVKFGAQPHLRVRLCWGGDTLRVVQRDNLPSPIVPGTTYRDVYIAVELIGRVNAECLANQIGFGSAQRNGRRPNASANEPGNASTSVRSCAFLGGAAAGAQNPRPPAP
jgi:hypothetical protein